MDSDSHALSVRDATLCRRLLAKLNLLAMDRPDIRYAASIKVSHASSPKEADTVKLNRVEQSLLGRPTTWTHFQRLRSRPPMFSPRLVVLESSLPCFRRTSRPRCPAGVSHRFRI